MGPNLSSTLEPDLAAGPSRVLPLTSRYIRFGPFQVDQQRQEVSKNGVRLRLWPADTHVNYDANVNTTVNKLRQALGDSSDKPLYIETIPRKGYCLVVRPEFADVPVAVAPVVSANGVNGKPHTESAKSAKTDIWMTLGIIGLILGGM